MLFCYFCYSELQYWILFAYLCQPLREFGEQQFWNRMFSNRYFFSLLLDDELYPFLAPRQLVKERSTDWNVKREQSFIKFLWKCIFRIWKELRQYYSYSNQSIPPTLETFILWITNEINKHCITTYHNRPHRSYNIVILRL